MSDLDYVWNSLSSHPPHLLNVDGMRNPRQTGQELKIKGTDYRSGIPGFELLQVDPGTLSESGSVEVNEEGT